MAGSTRHIIQIILQSNARDVGKDLGDAGDQGRRAGKGLGEAGDAAAGAGRNFASFGGLVREAATHFAGYLSAQAVFQGLSKAVEFAKDTVLGFDQQMTESLAIMGDQASGTRREMEMTAREVAVKYNAAVADVAQAYYFLASAGYDAETSQKAVGQVTAFAKAGMFDLEKATELAADAQNAMGLKSNDASENLVQLTRITDVLTKANIDANGSVEDFAKALTNKAAAGARLAGVSLESTVAVLEAFASQGLKGKRAGEAFTIVLRDLQDKSQENTEAFAALGVEVFNAQGQFNGFPTIIGQLEKSLQGMSVEQANATLNTLGFTAEGGAYLKTLLGMSGAISTYEEKLRSAGGATQQIAEKQMQSMVEKLTHLRVLAAEAALQGFDKLTEAVTWLASKFGPGIEAGADALREALRFAAPLAQALGLIAGGAVVGSMLALSAALQTVTGFLRDHSTIVQYLATVGFVLLVREIYATIGAYASLMADIVAFKLFDLAGQFDAWVISLRASAAASGVLSTSMGVLRTVMSSTIVQVGLISAAVFAMVQSFHESEDAANAMVASFTDKMDTRNVSSMQMAIKNLRNEADNLTRSIQGENAIGSWLGGMADMLIPIHDVEGSVKDMGAAVDAANDKISDLNKRTEEARSTIIAMAKDLSPANQKLEEGAGKFSMFNEQARALEKAKTGLEVQRITEQLQGLAIAANIDISQPVEKWKDELLKAYQASMNTSPTLAVLAQSFATVADETSSAEDAVKAYKDALDALIGVHISSAEAENGFAASLDTVHEKVQGGINLLDAYNPKNREARDAVLGAADAALKHAVSVYEETGSLGTANGVLGAHREQLINAMVQTGMTRQSAEAYINTLGLTPKNIETLAKLNKDQAAAAAADLQRQLDQTARDRQVRITADVSAAEASLARFGVKLNDMERRVIAANQNYDSGMRPHAQGGIDLYRYGTGGMTENHVAQFAPAGSWRLWAEPETGGEAYIPLADAKRGRSTDILGQVAKMFGYSLVKMAGGGTYGMADALGEAAYALKLSLWTRGQTGLFWEDWSFQGQSDAYNKGDWNDKLADAYWAANPGARLDTMDDWLRMANWAESMSAGMKVAASAASAAAARHSVSMAPGSIVVNAGTANPSQVAVMVRRELERWSRTVNSEVRARRLHRTA